MQVWLKWKYRNRDSGLQISHKTGIFKNFAKYTRQQLLQWGCF